MIKGEALERLKLHIRWFKRQMIGRMRKIIFDGGKKYVKKRKMNLNLMVLMFL